MRAKKLAKSTTGKKLEKDVVKLRSEITNLKEKQTADSLKLAEAAYITGYTDAMIDMDEKADAMDKFIEKSLAQFEKEYTKKLAKPKNSGKRPSTAKRKSKKLK